MNQNFPPHARVLIIDDQDALTDNISDLLTQSFKRPSLDCVISRSADAALASAAEPFEVALLDLHLPDGNGLQLMSQLRKRWPHVQVVVITGDATVESAIRALEEGAFSYLLKPFQPQQLVATTRKALERCFLLREREELQQTLRETERRNREVIDFVPAFVVALDENERIVTWNKQLELVTGFSQQEMLGKSGSGLIVPDALAPLTLKGGGHRSVRWRMRTVTQRPAYPAVTYAVGVDVTEESEMQRRAIRAERLAAVGTLAAGLAHEVRNPLNSALLQLQLLERKSAKGNLEPALIQEVFGVVKFELDRLNHLVSDFLAFAKPKPLAVEFTELNPILDHVVQLCRVEAERSGVTVHRVFAPDLGRLPLEPQRVHQVALNLIRNAIEAMNLGGGELTVQTRRAECGPALVFDVIDTGPGFAEDAPIFDAFYTSKANGSGLGLAIVHSIVSEHGGSISVCSRAGRTCFSVELPQPAYTPEPPL